MRKIIIDAREFGTTTGRYVENLLDKLQDVLFVIDEYQQLFEAVQELETRLA